MEQNTLKHPFRHPELTEYGRLSDLTAHHKIDHDPPGNAWGLYKQSGGLELDVNALSS